jgi:hypothetical protein
MAAFCEETTAPTEGAEVFTTPVPVAASIGVISRYDR